MKISFKRYLNYFHGSHLIPFYVIFIFSIVVAIVLQARLLDIKSYWIQQILEVTANNAERNFHNQFDDLSKYIEGITGNVASEEESNLHAAFQATFEQAKDNLLFIKKIEISSKTNFDYCIEAHISDTATVYESEMTNFKNGQSTGEKFQNPTRLTLPQDWSALFYSTKQLATKWSQPNDTSATLAFHYVQPEKGSDIKFTFHIYKNYLANFLMDLFYEIHRSNLTKGNVPLNKSLFFIHTRKHILWLELNRRKSEIMHTLGYDALTAIENPIVEEYYDKWFSGVKLLNKPLQIQANDTSYWGISQPLYFNKQAPFYVGIATIEGSLIPFFHTTSTYLFYTYTILCVIGLLLAIGYAIKYYQHRKAQKQININEERLRILLESSNEGVFDVYFTGDQTHNVINTHFSPQNNILLGLDPNIQLTFEDWTQRIHPEMKEEYKNTLENCISTFGGYELEYQILHGHGEYFWVLSKGKMIEGNDSSTIRHIGTNINIDEKKKIALERSRIQERISRLFNNIPGLSYQCLNDEQWTMTFLSDQCVEITGYDKFEIMSGKPSYSELIQENYREYVWAEVQKSVTDKKQFRIQYPIQKKSGEIAWVLELGTPVFNKQEDLESLEGVIVDVTQSVKADELVRNSIIKTETFERQRISKELHDGLGQNLSVISINMKELAKQTKALNEDGRTLFENALKTLDDSISETRRIAHALLPKSLDDFGLVIALEAMIDKIKDSRIFEIRFFTNFEEDERVQQTTEIAIYRIFQEALNNIIKHANASLVEIQLMLNEKNLFLSIEDNGSGYDPELIKDKESSFGLDSMKNRVQSLKGFINIDSTPGKGTLITIEIPK